MDQSVTAVSHIIRKSCIGYVGLAIQKARILALVFAGEAEVARHLLVDAIGDQGKGPADWQAAVLADKVLSSIENPRKDCMTEWPIDMEGSNFQLQVWRALLAIPVGETRSYQEVARMIGRPKAVRAVAKACAGNRIGFLIPCHRVTGKSSLSGYRWGEARKRQLLLREGADLSAF